MSPASKTWVGPAVTLSSFWNPEQRSIDLLDALRPEIQVNELFDYLP